ncbi:MAG TPA: hypothetical protein VJ943_05985 [Desulfotignum sp.]|nr:hypothetical protein [Desulfotignum sp.]
MGVPSEIRKMTCFVVILSSVVWMTGCTQIFTGKKSAEPQTSTVSSSGSGVSDIQPTSPVSKKTTAVYYDFEDVLIPLELKVVQDKSVIVSTPGFTSGILVLKGRVERRSLINFFNNNMQKDNWSIVSQIKSPGNSIMVYEKATRCAVITIKSEHINTWVEVGVAARVNQDSLSGGMGGMSESDLTQ